MDKKVWNNIMNILVIDVGISNLSSLCNCLNFLGADFKITNNKKDLNNGTHIILPGVGSFDQYQPIAIF